MGRHGGPRRWFTVASENSMEDNAEFAGRYMELFKQWCRDEITEQEFRDKTDALEKEFENK